MSGRSHLDTWHLPPPRVLVALAVTLVAAALLGVRACTAGDGEGSASTTTTSVVASTAVSGDVADTTTTSVVILPDWYPKQVSRYSDRAPVVTVTTLPPTSSTTSTTTRRSVGTTGSVGAGDD